MSQGKKILYELPRDMKMENNNKNHDELCNVLSTA